MPFDGIVFAGDCRKYYLQAVWRSQRERARSEGAISHHSTWPLPNTFLTPSTVPKSTEYFMSAPT